MKFNQSTYYSADEKQPILILSKPSPCDTIVYVSSMKNAKNGELFTMYVYPYQILELFSVNNYFIFVSIQLIGAYYV